MPEKHAHGTGENLLIQNDIKGMKIKHMKILELEEHRSKITIQ